MKLVGVGVNGSRYVPVATARSPCFLEAMRRCVFLGVGERVRLLWGSVLFLEESVGVYGNVMEVSLCGL